MKGKDFLERFGITGLLQSKKSAVILLLIAFAGIALILLSEFIHPGSGKAAQKNAADADAQAYEEQTERRLDEIIGRISGVGRVEVMVTAESGVENVYEQDSKTQTDTSRQAAGDGNLQTQVNSSSEQNPTVVEGSGGGQQAILKLQRQPQVLGVVVVCDGGGKPDVQESVVNAVSVALGIPSDQVSVNPMRAK